LSSKKNQQVRLEPCDLPPAEEKPKVFSIQRRDGEVVCCWLCEQRVATKPFASLSREDEGLGEVDLCQVCSGLDHVRAAFLPSRYPHLNLLRDLMKATRAIVRQELLRGRAT
jgi:hypothetical protein